MPAFVSVGYMYVCGEGMEWDGRLTVEAVGEDAALDARVEEVAFDLEAGDFAGGSHVADAFHHEDEVDGENRQDYRAIEGELEGLHPDETRRRSSIDGGLVKVSSSSGNDTSNQ
jgi:hypothetical protein